MKIALLFAVFFGIALECSAQIADSKLPTMQSTIHYYPDNKEIVVSGDITIGTLEDVKKLTSQYKFEIFTIDSPGGDSRSAIFLANLIKEKGMTLVVDGACMSACANYLFVAASKKRVLPGSVVAIHGSLATGTVHFSSLTDEQLKLVRENTAQEQEFFKANNIDYSLLASYDSFILKLEKNNMIEVVKNGTGGANCPPIRGWAPTKDELISWGVKGIGDFWYPETPADFELVSKKTNLLAKYIVFGTVDKLEALCKKND
jgi:ATP-dependent protease ClpP protease subunit